MRVQTLIKRLQALEEKHGNITVYLEYANLGPNYGQVAHISKTVAVLKSTYNYTVTTLVTDPPAKAPCIVLKQKDPNF